MFSLAPSFPTSSTFAAPTQQEMIMIQMVQQLASNTSETHEKCINYLTFFGWNYTMAINFTVGVCQDLCQKSGITNIRLARRILEEAGFNLDVCQYRVDLVLKLMARTNLVHVFAYDCLLEYQWNFDAALQRIIQLQQSNKLPSHAFFHNPQPSNALTVGGGFFTTPFNTTTTQSTNPFNNLTIQTTPNNVPQNGFSNLTVNTGIMAPVHQVQTRSRAVTSVGAYNQPRRTVFQLP